LEPLPFTPEGLKAFNEAAELIDPMSRCIFPGIPRLNSKTYPLQIVHAGPGHFSVRIHA